MFKKLTHVEFVNKVRYIHGNKYTILGHYKDSRTKIKVRCNICGHEWMSMSLTKTVGRGCSECGKKKAAGTLKHPNAAANFIKKMRQIHGNKLSVIGKYNGACNKLEIGCNICHNKWQSKPTLLYKHGCPVCGYKRGVKKRLLSEESFLNKIKSLHGDKIDVLGNYKGTNKKILVKCNKCGYKWHTVSRYLSSGRGCPQCVISKGEDRIKRILDENYIKYEMQYTFINLKSPDGGYLRFDFAILDNSGNLICLIEYDGLQHFKAFDHFGGGS